MGVNFIPSLDGHDAKRKIGLITSADIVGNAIRIAGFVYAADFLATASTIRSMTSWASRLMPNGSRARSACGNRGFGVLRSILRRKTEI